MAILYDIKSGKETLFQKDLWLNGLTPMHLWADKFRMHRQQNGTVRKLCLLLGVTPFDTNPDIGLYLDHLQKHTRDPGDLKKWMFMGNRGFLCEVLL